MIYKCAMCDTVFTHKPLLSSHFDQHLLNQRVSVFKCPDCPLLFAQKRTMLEHLKVPPRPHRLLGGVGGSVLRLRAPWAPCSQSPDVPRVPSAPHVPNVPFACCHCCWYPEVGDSRGPCSACGFPHPHHKGCARGGHHHCTSALQNTHQPPKPREEPTKKAAVLLTPKQEPMETPVPKISDESSSSTEEDDPPSSPELRKAKRSRFQRKATSKPKGSGWTCGVCHSWFPERDEYVSHMKKDHGKVRGCGAAGGGERCVCGTPTSLSPAVGEEVPVPPL